MFGKIKKKTTVFSLGLVSFFANIASEMLYPITPIFLTTVSGASMTYVGVIEGIAEAISSLLKIQYCSNTVSDPLSDDGALTLQRMG